MADETICIIDDEGQERFLGNIMPEAGLTKSWPVYGDVPAAPMVPRSRWPELIAAMGEGPDARWLSPVHNQSSISMCNASATAGAMEGSRARQGLEHVSLSGGDLYRRICVGGRDRGSLLEDGLAESMKGGICSTKVVPYLDWRRAPSNPDAANYKVLEAFLCPEFDHCMSAVLAGFDLISGIMWFQNYKPDRDGWLPRPGSGGGGHAVHGYKPAMRGNEFGIWHQNSWGPEWGLRGRCVFPEASYEGPVGGWWAVRQVTTEAGDIPAPKF